MRLKHIKLVGFKSFVDATKVPFPHQMTCVVGPNGCGKSNVIDAVRWVLGESSAKNLRGDAMTDVIFNGSNARKPVSQASVELVFDNSSGRIQGEFASFAEISVKRLVTRDGRSDYFLNGGKCRRRDITDLFLGTGLGPRSYAIIEQGMISRLIESKPQELRIFIEEAAGISKYKERRRETENRMQHTRDNLERLTDVREELGTQLNKLQRQAAAAKRYKELKQSERRYKGELQALRWLNLEQQAEQLRQQQQQQQTELEKWIAEQRGSERGSDELRQQIADAKQQLELIQQAFYQAGNDITRLEAELQNARIQTQQQQQRRTELQHQLTELSRRTELDLAQQQEYQSRLAELEPELELSTEALTAAQEQVELHEAQWLQLQEQQQQQLEQQQQHREEIQRAQLKLERDRAQLQRAQDDLTRVNEQRQQLDQTQFAEQLTELDDQLEQQTTQLEQLLANLQQLQQAQQACADETSAITEQLEQWQDQLHQKQGRQSSIKTLLEAEQAQDWPAATRAWLTQQQLQPLGQVRDLIDLPSHWQLPFEQLVGDWLDAWVITELPKEWPSLQGARLVVLNESAAAPEHSLAALVSGPLKRWRWLQQIQVKTPTASELAADTSIAYLNENGEIWSSYGYQAPQLELAESQLHRQQELQQLDQELAELATKIATAKASLAEYRQQQVALQEQREQEQQKVANQRAQVDALKEKRTWLQQQQQQHIEQQHQLELREAELAELINGFELSLEEAELELVHAETALESLPLHDFQMQKEQLQQQRQHLREQLQVKQQAQQQTQLQQQQLQHQIAQAEVLLERNRSQQQQAEQQLAELALPDDTSAEQIEMLALQLEERLAQREQIESERREASNVVAALEEQLRELSSGSQGVEAQIERARQALQSTQLELAALQERSRNVLSVLADMNQQLKPILEQLSDDAEEQKWQAEVERLQQAINRLGAINLAAIEEAETLAERKTYLDQQHQDLSESLETLETAIKKIDRETRQRFRTTFEAVNSGLQELFPKVFGGGSAYLDLTDDDLLETGVTIMARPPGKKNSTIHLLSGGEKALTALSLVFAIFRLNPAPFCLLDEVDAPLDDANVGRFCRLVSEMSQSVQFIYISHNKIAMEMASHLAGVTMQEPGVSRLVAVDIEEAIAMSDA